MLDVITIRLNTDDVSRIRFALSPVWETVTSVRALSNNTARSVHGPWLQKVRPIIDGQDLTLLKALIPSFGYIPDFITPAPPRRSTSFESGLAAIAATPHTSWSNEIGKLHRRTRTRCCRT